MDAGAVAGDPGGESLDEVIGEAGAVALGFGDEGLEGAGEGDGACAEVVVVRGDDSVLAGEVLLRIAKFVGAGKLMPIAGRKAVINVVALATTPVSAE